MAKEMDRAVVTVAFGIALGFAVLAAVLGVSTFVRRLMHGSRTERQARTWALVHDSVYAVATGDRLALRSVERALRSRRTLETAVAAFADAARADEQMAMALGERLGTMRHLRRWVNHCMHHPDPGRRVEAAEVAGTLHLWHCRGAVAVATRDPNPEVRVMACRALAALDPERAVGVLLRLVETDGPWASELLSDIVMRSGFRSGRALLDRAQSWTATPGLLKVIAARPTAGAETVLAQALLASDEVARQHAVAGLAETRVEGTGAALADMLADARETVRLAAVRALGRLDDPERALDLAAVLDDPSRLVRFAAANALSGSENGRYVLMKIARGMEDRAAEAAHLALWQYYELDEDAPDADAPPRLAVVPRPTTL